MTMTLPDLPTNTEAEQGLLAAILHNNRAFDRLPEEFGGFHFADPAHRRIFEACEAMVEKGREANAVSLSHLFKHDGDLSSVGGDDYLAQLQAFGSFADPRTYADLLVDLWQRRRIIEASHEALTDASSPQIDDPATEVAKRLQESLDGLETASEEHRLVDASEASHQWLTGFVEPAIKAFADGRIHGVPTGVPDLDERLRGLQAGHLVVLAAFTAQYKSALAGWIARASAISAVADAGSKAAAPLTLFYTSEMLGAEVMGRILAMDTGIAYADQSAGRVSQDQFERLLQAQRAWAGQPFVLYDKPSMRIRDLWVMARKLHRQRRLRLIVVDYVQLMIGDDPRSREREVASVTRQLKQMAGEFACPVLALSQLSREIVRREDKRPRLSDLRESGALEQDANIVMMNHNEHYWLEQDKPVQGARENKTDFDQRVVDWMARCDGTAGRLEIIVAKHRGSQSGYSVTVPVDPPTARFG